MHTILNALKRNMIAGILVLLPASITWLLIVWIWDAVNQPLYRILEKDAGWEDPVRGIGLFIVLAGIYLIGMAARSLIGQTLIRFGERVVNRLPVVRSIYGGLKQVAEAILGDSSNAFRKVVLLEYPRKGVWTVAFLTGDVSATMEAEIDTLEGDTRPVPKVYCFVPTTPNPTSGYLVMVPRDEVIHLDISVDDALKLVISGGMVSPYKHSAQKK